MLGSSGRLGLRTKLVKSYAPSRVTMKSFQTILRSCSWTLFGGWACEKAVRSQHRPYRYPPESKLKPLASLFFRGSGLQEMRWRPPPPAAALKKGAAGRASRANPKCICQGLFLKRVTVYWAFVWLYAGFAIFSFSTVRVHGNPEWFF